MRSLIFALIFLLLFYVPAIAIDTIITGTINSTSCNVNGIGTGCIKINSQSAGTIVLTVTGNGVGQLRLQARTGTKDALNNPAAWEDVEVYELGKTAPLSGVNGNGTWITNIAGRAEFLVKATNYSSGTFNVILEASPANFNLFSIPIVSKSASAQSSQTTGLSLTADCIGYPILFASASTNGSAEIELLTSTGSDITSISGLKRITAESSFVFSDVVGSSVYMLRSSTPGVGLNFSISCTR